MIAVAAIFTVCLLTFAVAANRAPVVDSLDDDR